MKKYEIWSKGFRVTGCLGGTKKHGEIEADSFKEACDKLVKDDKDFERFYDSEMLTFWGCSLFCNEEDARRTFG